MINRFKSIAGKDPVAHLMTGREFVSSEWMGYLNARDLNYHIRVHENFYVSRLGNTFKAYWIFNNLRLDESKHLDGIYYLNGQACYLSGSKIKGKDGKSELQILVSYCNAKEVLKMYCKRGRWRHGLRA